MKNMLDRFRIKVEENDKQIEMTIKEVIEKGVDADSFYDSLVKFEDLRGSGKRKANMIDYIKAVEFCTYVVSGLDYTTAYRKTFPDRVKKHIDNGSPDEWISRYANVYANGELVGNIMARVYISQYIMFIDKSIKAKMELYDIGMTAKLDRDRINALDKFLIHIEKDEEQAGVVNNITMVNGKNIVDAVEERLNTLASNSKDAIEKGIIDAKVVAEGGLTIKSEPQGGRR